VKTAEQLVEGFNRSVNEVNAALPLAPQPVMVQWWCARIIGCAIVTAACVIASTLERRS